MSWYDAVTFDLIRSGLSRTTFPQGKAFLCPGGFFVDFYRSGIAAWRAGHAAAPTRKNDPASRPYTRSSLFSFLLLK